MERKHFLKNSLAFIGLATIAPLANSFSKNDAVDLSNTTCSGTTSSGTTSSGTTSSGTSTTSCTVSPTETAGPFPTKTPSSLVTDTITSDRTGVPLTIKIVVNKNNNSCAALAGAIVDLWHCDKDGYYLEYGGSGMQSANYTSVHFLEAAIQQTQRAL